MRIRSLKSMEGECIVAKIRAFADDLVLVRLHRVEPHGIWVEHQAFTNRMMRRFGTTSSTTTLVLFVPFAGIDFVVGAVHALSLSEESFGLNDE
jgi:hypothetical protein